MYFLIYRHQVCAYAHVYARSNLQPRQYPPLVGGLVRRREHGAAATVPERNDASQAKRDQVYISIGFRMANTGHA